MNALSLNMILSRRSINTLQPNAFFMQDLSEIQVNNKKKLADLCTRVYEFDKWDVKVIIEI